ncbi:MAG: hypothetical protein KAJ51_16135, partial [Thermoplasmata archaeon]|nr:hypothetical protein [Thermoplasmata archaeon]
MKIKLRFFIWLVILVLFCGMLVPCVNAETFDIGTKISESELDLRGKKLIYFDTGNVVYTDPDYVDYVPLILDGNSNTGIDHDFGPGHDVMYFELVFPYAYYVSNITIKPSFGGDATNYTLYTNLGGGFFPWFADDYSTQQTFQINSKINGIWFELDNDGTNHFYFNDIIINYTSTPSNIDEVIQALNNLTMKIESLENQLNNLNDSFNILNNITNNLNATINNINHTQHQILENVSNLWKIYDQLNGSFTDIIEELENLNLTTYENITKIENDLILIETDIYDIYRSISNLTTNVTELLEIQDQIDETTLNINNLNENVTAIKNTMPTAYNDTNLMEELQQVKSENIMLNQELDNLTTEVENLKGVEKERVIEKEADNSGVYGAIIFGIIGIIIALIALALIFKRTKLPPSIPVKEEQPVPTPQVEQPPQPQVKAQEPAVEH